MLAMTNTSPRPYIRRDLSVMWFGVTILFYCTCSSMTNCFVPFAPAAGRLQNQQQSFTAPIQSKNGRSRTSVHRRNLRTRLRESIRENREKIERARDLLRQALRENDKDLAARLKAFILHLRKQDPQFATQDAMNDAMSKGLFATAAKLKLQLDEINQNPFRQGLLEDQGECEGKQQDISEDMSWGYDQTFFQKEGGDNSDEDEDYDDI